MMYLARKFKKFLPDNEYDLVQVECWVAWQLATQGVMTGSLFFFLFLFLHSFNFEFNYSMINIIFKSIFFLQETLDISSFMHQKTKLKQGIMVLLVMVWKFNVCVMYLTDISSFSLLFFFLFFFVKN